MTPERWRQLSRLIAEAREHRGADRHAFLQKACANDESLLHDAESFLEYDDPNEGFMKTPVAPIAAAMLAREAESAERRRAKCQACGAMTEDASRFCPACGAPMPTGDAPTHTDVHPVGRFGSDSASGDGKKGSGFTSGTILGGRFRIVGLLGRGGMGEVYRADDLTLGQTVALKFLASEFVDRPGWRERFYTEVRLARQVSHPNVCRIYDIGEIDGRLFLSMEYIDGEDLASLLKRVGHLPAAKVLELAKQLCAGLVAAHDKLVLHRDLKPANVMIDSRGHARITDFGLAISDEATRDGGPLLGTPGYMAPEQLSGQAASIRSDIYALGLVLYEICTGQRAFRARTIEELRIDKASVIPPAPSEVVRDVDPAVERVILKCMERDPGARPASVRAVASMLPGGDPLSAALAAGETPSPEVVAASASSEGLSARTGWSLIAALVVFTAATMWLGERAVMTRRAPLERPPEAFVERARQIAEMAGYDIPPADTAYGVSYNDAFVESLETSDPSGARWNALSSQTVRFWYRQSPGPLKRLAFSIGVNPTVTLSDPPMATPGELVVVLNGDGRLTRFTAVPTRAAEPDNGRTERRWTDLFRAAGLDLADWKAADPLWTPAFWGDARAAWQPVGGGAGQPLRIEAASALGRPVEFQVVYRWDRPGGDASTSLFYDRGFGAQSSGVATRVASLIGIGLTAVALFGGLIVARRNLRLGRGDRRGASRLVAFVTILLSVAWMLDEHHLADPHEWYLLIAFAGRVLVLGMILWWTYVGFEPYVRRHWPSTIVSWSRLLGGGVRDPLVARDVLIGCVAGAAITSLLFAGHLLSGWFGWPAERLATPTWHAWLGMRQAVSLALQLVGNALFDAFTALFLLVVLRRLLHREYLAAVVAAALLALPDVFLSDNAAVSGAVYFTVYLLGVMLLTRVGLLAVIALRFTVDLLQVYPIVPHFGVWYGTVGLAALGLLALIAGVSLRLSIAPQPAR